jgi:hypothetical protein
VGLEGGVMGFCKGLLAAAVAASLLAPAAAFAARSADAPGPRTRIKVHPKPRWHGYGYLPGYRPFVNNLDWQGRSVSIRRPEPRYFNWYDGQPRYGWGAPGFYRGRYNGGSFGPCWTSTPIGMMPTCGQ